MTKECYFQNRNNFISEEDKKWCKEYCDKHWAEEVTHIIRIADDAVEQRFLFDLRWDMERTYEPVMFDGEIVWDYMPGDDQEFIFQFNRHSCFICLGQAYAMTGKEVYAESFAKLLKSWIQKNPLDDQTKKTTWRSIEAGIRAEVWIKAMGYFKDSPWIDDTLLSMFADCMSVHAEYLMTTYKEFQIKSNWGVIENRGLMEIALAFPQWKRSGEYLEVALNRLYEEIQVQILDDGIQWEQSPMYHNEVFHCYLEVLRLASRYEVTLPELMREKISKMAYANLSWKKPNHCQIMQGDSDETDIRDLMCQSAYLLKDPVLKFGAYEHMDYDGTWDFLKTGVLSYEDLKPQEPDFRNRMLEESGNLYIRSGWEEESDFFHFRCGFLGGGHGHSDKLHVDLVIAGEDVLMDTGRYHYVTGEPRTWFKSAMGHNVPLVDGQDYLICQDAWNVGNKSAAYMGRYCKKGIYTFIQGSHGGYMNAGQANVMINRKIIGIGTDLYVVADQFYTTERHQYQQMFHFNTRGTVTLDGNTACYTGERAQADISVVSGSCVLELSKSRLSRNYNQIELGQQLLVSREKEGFCSVITVISGSKKEEANKAVTEYLPVSAVGNVPLGEADAEAIRITWKGSEYVVIISHKDIGSSCDLLSAGGVKGLGSVIVFDTEQQKIGGTVLHW